MQRYYSKGDWRDPNPPEFRMELLGSSLIIAFNYQFNPIIAPTMSREYICVSRILIVCDYVNTGNRRFKY